MQDEQVELVSLTGICLGHASHAKFEKLLGPKADTMFRALVHFRRMAKETPTRSVSVLAIHFCGESCPSAEGSSGGMMRALGTSGSSSRVATLASSSRVMGTS